MHVPSVRPIAVQTRRITIGSHGLKPSLLLSLFLIRSVSFVRCQQFVPAWVAAGIFGDVMATS